jgi:hypothetical protein
MRKIITIPVLCLIWALLLSACGEKVSKEQLQNNSDQESKTVVEEIIEETKQFGEDGFSDKFTAEEICEVSVSEVNGTVYVLWDVCLNDIRSEEYYLSVAKDSKWITKDKFLFGPNDGRVFIAGEYLYWFHDEKFTNDGSLIQYKLNETGELKSKTRDYRKVRKPAPIVTSNGFGVIALNPKGNGYSIYLENDFKNPIFFKDPHSLVQEDNEFDRGKFYADLEKQQLFYAKSETVHWYINEWSGVTRIDMTSGEPLYNSEGKDKVTEHSGSFIFGSNNGHIYVMSYTERMSDSMTALSYYDQDLNFVSSGFKSTRTYTSNKTTEATNVTFTNDEIHLWNMIDFKRKPSLQLVKVLRID